MTDDRLAWSNMSCVSPGCTRDGLSCLENQNIFSLDAAVDEFPGGQCPRNARPNDQILGRCWNIGETILIQVGE